MMKPKVALVKDGFVDGDHTWSTGDESKRGRLSGAAIERCKVLAAQGWKIEGYVLSSPAVQMETAGAMAAQVEKVKVATGAKEVADIPESPLRDEDYWTAYAHHNGKIVPVGMRTVCNRCGSSLTYCPCKSPVVWVDHDADSVVNFKPRN